MAKGPQNPRPLPTVLAALDYTHPGLILVKGREYYRIRDVTNAARRAAKSGPPETRFFLGAFMFWADQDPEGRVVIMRHTPSGPRPFAAEEGSRFVSWTLDERESRGPESVLSGPPEQSEIEIFDPFPALGSPGRRKGCELPPEHRQVREGFWRTVQRIHRGIPGIVGSGVVNDGQFTGGLAGVRTAWLVKPNTPSPMIDAVPVAGFYAFGPYWPQMLGIIGLGGTFDVFLRKLENEFGYASDKDLERSTVPNPGA